MALIAFDGTWNKDESDVTQDTNVAHFRDVYSGPVKYLKGVGTRLGWVGRLFGGLFGAGGEDRIDEAIRASKRFRSQGDPALDVIGFSRGSAIALDFCNELREKSPGTRVRFLGLWDVVASFGVPGNAVNLGKDLSLSDNVDVCCHAMAIDERRGNFPVTRIRSKSGDAIAAPRLTEVWFRGVHSDVGGGNGKVGLSSIALCWMIARATACGVTVAKDKSEAWKARRNPDEPLFANKDPIPDPFRKLFPTDVVHDSGRRRAGSLHQNPLDAMRVVGDDGVLLPQPFGVVAARP